MFRKLLIESVIVLVLIVFIAAIGFKEAPEEAFVGTWSCEYTVNKRINFNPDGTPSRFKDQGLSQSYTTECIKDGEKFFLKNGTNLKNFNLDAIKKHNDKWFDLGKGMSETKQNVEFIFISNDELKIITKLLHRIKKSKLNKAEIYTETVCKRITD